MSFYLNICAINQIDKTYSDIAHLAKSIEILQQRQAAFATPPPVVVVQQQGETSDPIAPKVKKAPTRESIQATIKDKQEKLQAITFQVEELIDRLKQTNSELGDETGEFIDAIVKDIRVKRGLQQATENTVDELQYYALDMKDYEVILPYAKLAYALEQNGDPEDHATKLAMIFGNIDNVMKYLLKKGETDGQNMQFFHNACLFNCPGNMNWTFETWRNLIKQDLSSKVIFDMLPEADRIEEQFQKMGKPFTSKTSYKTLREVHASLLYANGYKNPEAAALFKKYFMSERDFNQYLSLTPKDSDRIPNVVIDGKNVHQKCEGYYIKKLNPADPMAAVLGEKTGCCQSIGGAGRECAIHGITSIEGGFYVLCAGDPNHPSENDDIKAQSWAWRSQTGALVFDSVESQQNFRDANMNDANGAQIISMMFADLAATLVGTASYNIPRVNVGYSKYANTPSALGVLPAELEIPIDYHYDGYRDSNKDQRVVCNKEILAIRRNQSEGVSFEIFAHVCYKAILRGDFEHARKIIDLASKDYPEFIHQFFKYICSLDAKNFSVHYLFKDSAAHKSVDASKIAVDLVDAGATFNAWPQDEMVKALNSSMQEAALDMNTYAGNFFFLISNAKTEDERANAAKQRISMLLQQHDEALLSRIAKLTARDILSNPLLIESDSFAAIISHPAIADTLNKDSFKNALLIEDEIQRRYIMNDYFHRFPEMTLNEALQGIESHPHIAIAKNLELAEYFYRRGEDITPLAEPIAKAFESIPLCADGELMAQLKAGDFEYINKVIELSKTLGPNFLKPYVQAFSQHCGPTTALNEILKHKTPEACRIAVVLIGAGVPVGKAYVAYNDPDVGGLLLDTAIEMNETAVIQKLLLNNIKAKSVQAHRVKDELERSLQHADKKQDKVIASLESWHIMHSSVLAVPAIFNRIITMPAVAAKLPMHMIIETTSIENETAKRNVIENFFLRFPALTLKEAAKEYTRLVCPSDHHFGLIRVVHNPVLVKYFYDRGDDLSELLPLLKHSKHDYAYLTEPKSVVTLRFSQNTAPPNSSEPALVPRVRTRQAL